MARINNIVLVHGAFVDGSSWAGVYDVLKEHGFTVSVVQNPTISLEGDVSVIAFNEIGSFGAAIAKAIELVLIALWHNQQFSTAVLHECSRMDRLSHKRRAHGPHHQEGICARGPTNRLPSRESSLTSY